jgi:hypothetical protein
VKKDSNKAVDLTNISYNFGDIEKILPYLPDVDFRRTELDAPFVGTIKSLHW